MPLAFPSPAAKRFEEEDVSSPSPATATNSPAFAIDPGLLDPEQASNNNYFQYEPYPSHEYQQPPHLHPPEHGYIDQQAEQQPEMPYSRDFPQGPPPEPIFMPEPEEPPLTNVPRRSHKKPRRERKPRKEPNCGFCLGDNSRNKEGLSERMLSCSRCGRSGHPSCLEIAHIAEIVYNYSWECIECKKCEICKEKGDDTRLLFCDNCDRGWHFDCLDPPLLGPPEGNWSCPYCPPLLEEDIAPASYIHEESGDEVVDEDNGEDLDGDEEIEEQLDDSLEVVEESSAPKPRGSSARNRKNPKSSKKRVRPRPSVGNTSTPRPKKARPSHRPSRPLPSASQNSGPSGSTHGQSNQPKVTFRLRLGKNKILQSSDDEQKSQFENFLSPDEYDTAKTLIIPEDKTRFEKSRVAAENKLHAQIAHALLSTSAEPSSSGTSTHRPLRSLAHLLPLEPPSTPGGSFTITISTPGVSTPTSYPLPHPHAPHVPSSLSLSTLASVAADSSRYRANSNNDTHYGKQSSSLFPESHPQPAPLRIRTIRFGEWDIDTWYDAPFPEEYNNIPEGRLWMCEFCLKYMKSAFGWERHQTKCKARHPPGDEIYRDDTISVFEVDGRRNKIYCQNLCLLSKMFLDHKSLFYDVEPFLFYVMTEVDDSGAHFVGYFSKEKRSAKECNLSCIMTLPVRQRKGWGNLLIDFSYLLSKKEQRPGSPERPLSALGALSYRNYWTLALMRYLHTNPSHVTFERISANTGMMISDIVATLREQGFLTVYEKPVSPLPLSPLLRGSKGKARHRPRTSLSTYSRRNSSRKIVHDEKDDGSSEPSIPESYSIDWDKEIVQRYLDKWNSKGYLTLKPDQLKWSPYLLSRNSKLEATIMPIASEEPASAQDAATTSVASSTVVPHGGRSGPGSVSGEGGQTAVEQVANGGYADAGPSTFSPPLAGPNYDRASPSSPSTANLPLDGDDDKDSEFEPDDFEATPTRSRRSSSLLKPTRTSRRTLSRNASEMSDATRSIGISERRLTRQRSAIELNGGDRLSFPPVGSSSSRQSSLRLRPNRKRKRVDSPESSLTEASDHRSESPSVVASDLEIDEEEGEESDASDLPRPRRSQAAANGSGSKTRPVRKTRSNSDLGAAEAHLTPRSSRKNAAKPNGRAKPLIITDDEEDTLPSPPRPTRLNSQRRLIPEVFIDDPEDALRKRKRAKLEEALGRDLLSPSQPFDNHQNHSSHMVVQRGTVPQPVPAAILPEIGFSQRPHPPPIITSNGNGVVGPSYPSPTTPMTYPGSGPEFSLADEDIGLDEDAIGEVDPEADADAEGEEEVLNTVYQPFGPEDDADLDDMDAEGEIDLDAEGEAE